MTDKWHDRKAFAYILLITWPLLIIIGYKYGFTVEIIALFSIILGQNLNSIVNWLATRF